MRFIRLVPIFSVFILAFTAGIILNKSKDLHEIKPSTGEQIISLDDKDQPLEIVKARVIDDTPVFKPIPLWQKNAVKISIEKDKPKIAIVIDDLGLELKRNNQIINLPAPLTLAFLPYGPNSKNLAKQAIEKGHELIIHMPMEALNHDLDLGEMSLRTNMNNEDFLAEIERMMHVFDGYVGINNHMGSALTQNSQAMTRIMKVLKARELLFLDSKTIHTSIAAEAAENAGIPYAVRDVFLDHEHTEDFITAALFKTEKIAQKYGQAIAIGHPKVETIKALDKWIPEAQRRGFQLVPISALVIQPVSEISAEPS